MADPAADETQREGPTTDLRLYVRASNLPKSLTGQQPDTLARISLLPAPPGPPSEDGGGDDAGAAGASSALAEGVLDETEVVSRCSNPKWTTPFSLAFEYGSQLLVFVDIFVVSALRTSIRSSVSSASSVLSAGDSTVQQRGLKLLGRAAFDVQDVLGSRGQVKARRLRDGGVVYVHAEPRCRAPSRSLLAAAPRLLRLRLRASDLVPTRSVRSRVVPGRTSKPDTYYEVARPSSAAGTWIVAYRSPTVTESVSPSWDEAVIDLAALLPAATSAAAPSPDLAGCPVAIAVYKVKRKKCKEIGSCQTTLANLVATGEVGPSSDGDGDGGGDVTLRLQATARGGATPSDDAVGLLTVARATVEGAREISERSRRFLAAAEDDDGDADDGDADEADGAARPLREEEVARAEAAAAARPPSSPRPKFSEYVAAGLELDFCVAVDFTSSNGDPRVPGTQHFSRHGMMNDYEEAIAAVGGTMEKYSTHREYPVWGFGAKYGGQVRHIFQCGDSATAFGTQGVLDAYRKVFETDLIMSGPTEIHAVLRAAAARAKKFYGTPSSLQYCVLLILTDGIVNDLHATQELIRSYQTLQLPLSVVVVGIGRADFTEFCRWGDAPPNVRGRCKFVEFRKHQFDPDALSREVLANVPHEIVDNLLARSILPSDKMSHV